VPNFNQVILVGNLTRDPDLKHMPSSDVVSSCAMAINRKWTGKDGKPREDATFVEFSAYGKIGEILNQYGRKGLPIMIEGRLKLDQWTAQDGSKRNRLMVIAENIQLLGRPDKQDATHPDASPAQAASDETPW
jgi:single-strand DNA-binding protein